DRVEQNSGLGENKARTEKLVSVRVTANGRYEPALEEHRAGNGRTLQGEQCRAHEDLRPDERRDGVPGESEHDRRPAHSECKWLDRLDRDTPEDLLHPELSQDPADEIVPTDGHAARGDEDVGREASFERLAMRCLVV